MAATVMATRVNKSRRMKQLMRRFLLRYANQLSGFVLAILAGLLIVVLLFHLMDWHIGFNTSLSAPRGLYRLTPVQDSLKRGELVGLQAPLKSYRQRHYIPENGFLIKHIGAIPGEYLFTEQYQQYACQTDHFDRLSDSCRFLGSCLRFDSQGRKMHCQSWFGKLIPQDYYYVMSNRVPNSFDSRYFGLVSQSEIPYQAHRWPSLSPEPENQEANKLEHLV